ncbi:MAG: PTS cellobiose transporter subunit IIC [Bacillota bacterium]
MENKIIDFLERHFVPLAGRVGSQRHIKAIRDGVLATIPFIIIGSVFLMIACFPVASFGNFMTGLFGAAWNKYLFYPVDVTFGLMAVVACAVIAYRLAESYKTDGISAMAISLTCFMLLIPIKDGLLAVKWYGSPGLFTAMITAIVATEIFRYFSQKGWTIKMPDGVPPAVAKPFASMIPAGAAIIVFLLIRVLFENTSYQTVFDFITQFLGKPLAIAGNSLPGVLLTTFTSCLFWSLGVHGNSVVNPIMDPTWYGLMDANRMAFQAGLDLPNIVTKQFIDNFIQLGGSGATLSLAVMMLFFAKSTQLKSLGKIAIWPGLFNINEPLIFGMPIILNPVMIIPFILSPLVICLLTYLAMSMGFVAKLNGIAIPWTTPVLISGYLTTGNISGLFMQAVGIAVSAFIYFPFFKLWDKKMLAEEMGGE